MCIFIAPTILRYNINVDVSSQLVIIYYFFLSTQYNREPCPFPLILINNFSFKYLSSIADSKTIRQNLQEGKVKEREFGLLC